MVGNALAETRETCKTPNFAFAPAFSLYFFGHYNAIKAYGLFSILQEQLYVTYFQKRPSSDIFHICLVNEQDIAKIMDSAKASVKN